MKQNGTAEPQKERLSDRLRRGGRRERRGALTPGGGGGVTRAREETRARVSGETS